MPEADARCVAANVSLAVSTPVVRSCASDRARSSACSNRLWRGVSVNRAYGGFFSLIKRRLRSPTAIFPNLCVDKVEKHLSGRAIKQTSRLELN